MSRVSASKSYFEHALFVGFLLAWPLWREFDGPNQPIWNAFLAVFLGALVIGAFIGVRRPQRNRIELGEARFAALEHNR